MTASHRAEALKQLDNAKPMMFDEPVQKIVCPIHNAVKKLRFSRLCDALTVKIQGVK